MRPILLLLAVLLVPLAASAQDQLQADGPFSAVFRGVPLDEALEELVGLTGIDLVFDASLVAEHRAYCSRRRAAAEELLRCVLEGSGLDFVRSSSGAYVVIVSPRQPPRLARLAGRVVDAQSGEPMPFAHVMLADGGTTTDLDGYFAFAELMPGEHRVVATFVGYEAAVLDGVRVEPGASQRLVVRMRPGQSTLAPIVVDGLTQRLPSAGLGRSESVDPAPAMVAGTADVMRGAAATIGVSSALPLADLHIQGGNTAEHVTRLDGVAVRDPVALGRYLGAFSPLAIRDVTVHKAGFGVGHGSLIAGAIDLRHDLAAAAPGAALQVDAVSVNARASSPVSWPAGGGALMVAYRQSTFGVYADPGIAQLLERANLIDPLLTGMWLGRPMGTDELVSLRHVPDVAFSDAHVALRIRPDAYSSLQASLFRAGNFVAADHTASFSDAAYLLSFRDVYDWANWASQVQYSRLLGARATMLVRARGSHHASSYGYQYSAANATAGPLEPAGERDTRGSDSLASDSGHRLLEGGLDAHLTLSLAPGRNIEGGLSVDFVDARFHAENAWVAPFVVEAQEVLLSGFAQARLAIREGTTIEGGTRLTAHPASGRFFAEPRASVRLDGELDRMDGYALRISAGLYRQFVNGFSFRSAGPAALVPELWFWLPITAQAHPPRSLHTAVEGLLLPGAGWTLRAEAYHRWEPHLLALDVPLLLSSDDPTPSPVDISAPVRGRAIGAGASVEWTGRPGSAAISYSFEHARRESPTHTERGLIPAPWEEPHRLSFDGRLRLGHGFGLESAARGVWGRSWGFRRAYYDYLADPELGAIAEQVSRPETQRLPALLLVDGKTTYERTVGGTILRLELGVANLLDRENVLDFSLDSAAQTHSQMARALPGRRLTFAVRVGI